MLEGLQPDDAPVESEAKLDVAAAELEAPPAPSASSAGPVDDPVAPSFGDSQPVAPSAGAADCSQPVAPSAGAADCSQPVASSAEPSQLVAPLADEGDDEMRKKEVQHQNTLNHHTMIWTSLLLHNAKLHSIAQLICSP